MPQLPLFLSLKSNCFTSNPNPRFFNLTHKFLSAQSSFPNHTELPTPSSQFSPSPYSPVNPNPNPSLEDSEYNTLRTLLRNFDLRPGRDLENALDETGIEPNASLLRVVLKQLDSSPKHAFSLFKWAEKRPGYHPSAPIFNSMLGILARRGEFKWALMALLDKIKRGDGSGLVSADSFGNLIRHYARSGKILPAIRVCEFGNSLEMDLFEVLLNALCKYGHVSVASDCVDRKMRLDRSWVPLVRVYNLLFDGWFRVRNIKIVERLRSQMSRKNLVPDIVTYGILVEGYCGMGFVDRAIELLGEMRRGGVRPDGAVYDPIVEALAIAGRLEEALGMLERFLVLETGPSLLTYNYLVKGFCEAGDVLGAGKILKMMTSRGIMPTTMTYNYFFRYFKKHGKVEDGVNLYRKMIESGYSPDRWTFNLILKMLCEKEEVELALEISKEMRSREQVLDLATSTMIFDLLCKKQRLKEAVAELESLIQSGFMPKYIAYQKLQHEIKKRRLHDLATKLSDLMATVPQSTTLPITVEGHAHTSCQRRKTAMHKAKAMSDFLKSCSDHRELAKLRGSRKSASYNKNAVDTSHSADKG